MFTKIIDIFTAPSKVIREHIQAALKTDLPVPLLRLNYAPHQLEESVKIACGLAELGYTKLLVTSFDYVIQGTLLSQFEESLETLRVAVNKQGVKMRIEAVLVYPSLQSIMPLKKEEINFIHNGFLLFQSSEKEINQPESIDKIRELAQSNISPILIYPEIYTIFQKNIQLAEQLHGEGLRYMISLLAVNGAYGKPMAETAKKFIDNKLITLLSSGCEKLEQIGEIKKAVKNKYLRKAISLHIQNSFL